MAGGAGAVLQSPDGRDDHLEVGGLAAGGHGVIYWEVGGRLMVKVGERLI